MADANPKLCECGCGRPAPVATQTKARLGHVAGQPLRFIRGHANKGRAINVKHGMVGSRTYKSWTHMLYRCRSERCKAWPQYGGRGITVCERWLTFENFLADMGERPPGTSIDRIDNDGNYEPGNCRWATDKEQGRNTGRIVLVQSDADFARAERARGVTKKTIAKRLGVSVGNIKRILRRETWT